MKYLLKWKNTSFGGSCEHLMKIANRIGPAQLQLILCSGIFKSTKGKNALIGLPYLIFSLLLSFHDMNS